MSDKVSEICGACKGEFHATGRKAWWLLREWRVKHKCDGPQLTYLFQSAEPPTYVDWEDESD